MPLQLRARTSRASPAAGNGIFGCGDRAPKIVDKCANAHRDKNPGIEYAEIRAETPYLASRRKRVVCKDWMVVCAVMCELVSNLRTGNFLKITAHNRLLAG